MFNRKDPSPRRSPSHKDEMEDIKTHDTNLDCFQKEEASPVPRYVHKLLIYSG